MKVFGICLNDEDPYDDVYACLSIRRKEKVKLHPLKEIKGYELFENIFYQVVEEDQFLHAKGEWVKIPKLILFNKITNKISIHDPEHDALDAIEESVLDQIKDDISRFMKRK